MPNLHSEKPKRGDNSEEYQNKYHEFMLECFKRHPYMWGYYYWNMFDFAADARNQGGEPGMNHKGMITFDRKLKKDVFYLYKAYWTDTPFAYIAGRRYEFYKPVFYLIPFLMGYFVFSHDSIQEIVGRAWIPLMVCALVSGTIQS